MAGVSGTTQGRRGYYLYVYGTHLWFPETQTDWSAGMFRDVARVDIPANGVYDSVDFMLHQPGVAFKRGGTTYPNPTAMTGATYAQAVAYAQFPGYNTQLVTIVSGDTIISASTTVPRVPQLVAVGDNGTLYLLGTTGTSSLGTMPLLATFPTRDRPKFYISGSLSIIVFTAGNGDTYPYYYAGTISGPAAFFDQASATSNLATTGVPTGGTFKIQIGYTGGTGTVTTGTIAYNAAAATVQAALNAVSTGYICSGGALPTAVLITKPGPVSLKGYGGPDALGYAPLSVTQEALTGGSTPHVLLEQGTVYLPTAPKAVYAEVHLSRLLLANTKNNPNRVWFGPIPIILGVGGTWDTANAYIDATYPVTGMASVGGTLLVFSLEGFERWDGDTPPPGTNMSRRPVSNIGCTDARSILVYQGQCIYANTRGVYITTGVAPTALMEGTVQTYWRDLFTGYDPATWTISTGLFQGRFLFVTVLDASRTLVDTLMCDLVRRSWVRHTEPTAVMYASAYGAAEELFAAQGNTNRVACLCSFFTPSATYKADADGAAVAPTLTLRPFAGGPGISAFGKAHLSYDMRDAASDNPTLAVTVAPGAESTTFAAVAESPLAETSDATRTRYATGKQSQALSVKFTQANASAKTEIYSVEQDTRAFPRGSGGQ